MRKFVKLLFLFFLVISNAQENDHGPKYVLDFNRFNGSILLHNPDIAHLITSRPDGYLISLNRKRFGESEWESDYGYPDTGFTFIYQDMNNPTLGEHFGVYAHYNFYFFKRNLQLRIGQGIAYNTNPYDRQSNFRNNAYGSHLLSSTMALLNYQKERLFHGFGLKAGLALIHYSNANFRAPNTSTNTMAFNFGITYDLNPDKDPSYIEREKKIFEPLPIAMNVVLRGGINESDVVNSGQFGFWILSAYAEKRLGRKSALQVGADFFASYFLKDLIRFQSISFPEMEVDADTDFKRAGVFLGHELFINKLSVITQLGYYVYYPFDFEGRVYNRIGLKHYFGDRWFGAVTLKSHAAAAEAVEFGIGFRL
ncbi:acyloxyacyl hydrolase [Flagellimonas sp. DF-77]|uniref:acyloxyacyl hydrolase n=1 Tax=Flagellimonas algarum TaxID=3230298 RepID=UPI003395D2DF